MLPEFEFLPVKGKTWIQKYTPVVTSHGLYLIAFWRGLRDRFLNVFYGRTQLRPENLLVLTQIPFLWIFAPFHVKS